MNHALTILTIGTVAQCLAGCSNLASPQNRDQRATVIAGLGSAKVSVSGLQQNGATKGLISANSFYTQVLEAGSNSAISGSSVAFPPGALAIDTEIAIATTDAIGNNETLHSFLAAAEWIGPQVDGGSIRQSFRDLLRQESRRGVGQLYGSDPKSPN